MPHRYFTRELADGRAALTGSDAHHLADVMRARIGEEVVLCGPDGLEYLARSRPSSRGGWSFPSPTHDEQGRAGLRCDAVCGLPQGWQAGGGHPPQRRAGRDRGRAVFQPLLRSHAKKEDVKNERYNRIAAEAAKQAGRAMLPHVALPLNDFAAVCKAFADFDVVLFFYEGGGAPLREVLHPGQYKRVAIVTGSEGGFSVEEAEPRRPPGL